jgi:hypothetical protein
MIRIALSSIPLYWRQLFALCFGLLVLSTPARAQCQAQWLPGNPLAGVDGDVNAMVAWDPDGAGPQEPVVVVGGKFAVAGGVLASNIALWDGTSWHPLGSGLGGDASATVYALAAITNGDLIAAGSFTTAGGAPAPRIARWDGTAWSPLGSGTTNNNILALATLPDGELAAGGDFTQIAGIPLSRIARWNGAEWFPIGAGMDDSVLALAVQPNGDLVAGGSFTQAGSATVRAIARWTNGAWASVGDIWPSVSGQAVYALAVAPNGDIIAAGDKLYNGAAPSTLVTVARWTGSSPWVTLSAHLTNHAESPRALAVTLNGDIVQGGTFNIVNDGAAVHGVARWDGTTWLAMDNGVSVGPFGVKSLLVLPSGALLAGGTFRSAGSRPASRVASWDGVAWSPLSPGAATSVQKLAEGINGEVFVLAEDDPSTTFQNPQYAARWTEDGLIPLGIFGAASMTVMPNGDLIVGGTFTSAAGLPVNNIARWDGSAWSALGPGLTRLNGTSASVQALLALPNGDLIANGGFGQAGALPVPGMARWDGTNWSAFPNPGGQLLGALALLHDGSIVAAIGARNVQGSMVFGVSELSGSTWVPLGGPFTHPPPNTNASITSLAVLPNGDLVAARSFYVGLNSLNVARWSGSAWVPMGAGVGSTNTLVASLAVLGDGSLIETDGYNGAGARRWDGSTWSTFVTTPLSYAINTAVPTRRGGLLIGGDFAQIGSQVSSFVARWETPPACCADFNHDGDVGTDADIESFFACLAGACCAACGSADFNGDGDIGTDADIESFFRVLAGGGC